MQTSLYHFSLFGWSCPQPHIPLEVPFWLSSGPVRGPTVFGALSVSLASIPDAGCVVPLYQHSLEALWGLIYPAVEVLFPDIRNLAGETERCSKVQVLSPSFVLVEIPKHNHLLGQ
jgi:hypothetical protein